MKNERIEDLETLLGWLSTGILVLDCTDLRICYLNTYALTQIQQHLGLQEVIGRPLSILLPEQERESILSYLRAFCLTGSRAEHSAVPYEGMLKTRGKTYWHVTIEKKSMFFALNESLLIAVEDETEKIRSHIRMQAIDNITIASAGAYSLPRVLDLIVSTARKLVSTRHCAIFLIEQDSSNSDGSQKPLPSRRATIAAQYGIDATSLDWHPEIDERLLLSRVEHEQRTVMVYDTAAMPEIDLPSITESGISCHPRSVLSVPIVGPYALKENGTNVLTTHSLIQNKNVVLGSIELYDPEARSYVQEVVILLELLAQQAGSAIQNARLFRMSSQLVQAERRSAHQRAYVMQAIPDGVIIFDYRWRVTEINQSIRTLLGWDDTVLGQSIIQAFQKSSSTLFFNVLDLEYPIPELERRAHNGLIDEFKMTSADQQMYTIRCTYTPIHDDLGDIFAFIVIFHDVTEQTLIRERIEAEVAARTGELAARNESLRALKQANEDFFTTIAHELKTPLANIRAHLSGLLAKDVSWSQEEQYASLLVTDEQADRLVHMVDNILDASRVEANALRLDLEPIQLPELFEDLEERLKALILSSKRYLRIVYPASLPAVYGDYERLISVLTNLLSNAFRFVPEGDTVLLRAELYTREVHGETSSQGVKLSVIDRGTGITQEQQQALFTRFSSFASSNIQESKRFEHSEREHHKSRYWSSSSGLGLYISRGIIEAHGSKLLLQSEPGQGTTFSFVLPIEPQQEVTPGTIQ